MAPKTVKTMICFCTIFGSLFGEFLELFRCLLGAFLGFLRLSWAALAPQNLKKMKVFKVCANAGFWVFEALDWPLGPI